MYIYAAKLLHSCPTLCDPIDGSPPGSPVPGILQARTLEWLAISFANAWKWKVKVKSLSHVWPLVTPGTPAYQAPPSMGFSRQEYWSGSHCLLLFHSITGYYKILSRVPCAYSRFSLVIYFINSSVQHWPNSVEAPGLSHTEAQAALGEVLSVVHSVAVNACATGLWFVSVAGVLGAWVPEPSAEYHHCYCTLSIQHVPSAACEFDPKPYIPARIIIPRSKLRLQGGTELAQNPS